MGHGFNLQYSLGNMNRESNIKVTQHDGDITETSPAIFERSRRRLCQVQQDIHKSLISDR